MLAMQDHEKDYFTSDTSPSLLPTDWVLDGTFASADGSASVQFVPRCGLHRHFDYGVATELASLAYESSGEGVVLVRHLSSDPVLGVFEFESSLSPTVIVGLRYFSLEWMDGYRSQARHRFIGSDRCSLVENGSVLRYRGGTYSMQPTR